MDTFCIPRGKDYRETRLKAIDQMAMVFASASYVLILDTTLSPTSYPKMSPVDMFDPLAIGVDPIQPLYIRDSRSYHLATQVRARIMCSPWAGRGWTLQEAVLAHDTRFALNDSDVTSAWLRAACVTEKPRHSTQNVVAVMNDIACLAQRSLASGSKLCCIRQQVTSIVRHISILRSPSRWNQRDVT